VAHNSALGLWAVVAQLFSSPSLISHDGGAPERSHQHFLLPLPQQQLLSPFFGGFCAAGHEARVAGHDGILRAQDQVVEDLCVGKYIEFYFIFSNFNFIRMFVGFF
jgi:hypothetical protein